MVESRKKLLYWLAVGVLEFASLVLATFCIIKFVFQDNYLTGLAFFSAGICVLNGVFMVFHIEKLFNWYYKKMQLAMLTSRPEYFSTTTYFLNKEKSYIRLKLVTLILQGINILLQIVLMVI